MQNDPELNGKYLGTISQDFVQVSDLLKEASYQMRQRKISDYPIFPVSKTVIPVGQLILAMEKTGRAWNYSISLLDEFVQRNIVEVEKVAEFTAAYKNPDEFCCLFVVDGDFTNFVFIPYPED